MDDRLTATDLQILKSLGTLCHNRQTNMPEVAQYNRLPRQTAWSVLVRLVKLGLVVELGEQSPTYFPTNLGWSIIEDQ